MSRVDSLLESGERAALFWPVRASSPQQPVNRKRLLLEVEIFGSPSWKLLELSALNPVRMANGYWASLPMPRRSFPASWQHRSRHSLRNGRMGVDDESLQRGVPGTEDSLWSVEMGLPWSFDRCTYLGFCS